MPADPKIIYLEADEEVTSAVDKLRKTEFKKVVFVIPKEASLLQSVINLKLLKRQAETLEKSIAIVTQDKVGRILAEKIGILASSKLEEISNQEDFVPVPAKEPEEEPEDEPVEKKEKKKGPLEETDEIIFKKDNKKKNEEVEPEDLVVREEDPEEVVDFSRKEVEEVEDDNLMPRFPWKKFALIFFPILIFLLAAAFVYIPRAKATVLVEATKTPVSINFTGKKDASLDTDKAVVPVQVVDVTKENSKKFTATGKKNVGTKATGTIRIANLSGSNINWIIGTRFAPTANASLIFVSTTPVFAPDGQVTSIVVAASDAGDQYNGFGSNQAFTLVSGGLSSNVTITSKDGMNGGSNKMVSYVTAGDVAAAKDNLTNDTYDDATTDFNKQINNLKVIDDTKKKAVLSATASPDVNGEGTDFTMDVKVEIKALAINMDDISKLVKAEVSRQFGASKQVIDDGSAQAAINVDQSDLDAATVSGTIKANAFVSDKFDQNQMKDQLIGMNEQKATDYLKGLEGVQDTNLQFFPSFLKYFPRIKSHIILDIRVANSNGN